MSTLYHFEEAIRLSGLSRSAIRNYLRQYETHFSEYATHPPARQPRMFTAEDMRFLAFLKKVWDEEASYDSVIARIDRGELASFSYAPPTVEIVSNDRNSSGQQETEPEYPQVHHFGTMLKVVANETRVEHEREMQVIEENRRLYQQIEMLQRRLGQAEGELAMFKAKQAVAGADRTVKSRLRPNVSLGRTVTAWWNRLLGGKGNVSFFPLNQRARLMGAVTMLLVAILASVFLVSLFW